MLYQPELFTDFDYSASKLPQQNKSIVSRLYGVDEVRQIRNALKLATKFITDIPKVRIKDQLCMTTHIVQNAIILISANAKPEVIIAGLLKDVLNGHLETLHIDVKEQYKNRFFKIINQKFGVEVCDLIGLANSNEEKINEDVLLLKTVVMISDISAGFIDLHSESCRQAVINQKAKVGLSKLPCHIKELLEYEYDKSLGIDSNLSSYSEGFFYVDKIIDSLKISGTIFKDCKRSWGKGKKLPLIAHEAEVGLLLMLSGAAVPLVQAGFLHDAKEGYSKLLQGNIDNLILNSFGQRVVDLIDSNTEHYKHDQNAKWWDRKKEVLDRMSDTEDLDLLNLCCAAKISTIASGCKWKYDNLCSLDGWSQGSFDENCDLFLKYYRLFKENQISLLLTSQILYEINKFITPLQQLLFPLPKA